MSLWLCLRFGQLPLQCQSHSEDQPVVVLTKQRVLRANDCAAELGIREGMSGATVRALAGEQSILLLERDGEAEQRCLQQLCCWAYSITPGLHTWREDCLQLEIGGCLTLFGGLEALLAEVDSALGTRGYQVYRGLAANPKAAWLLSFASEESALDTQQPLPERLAPLPLQLLDAFADTVDSLRRAGLHTLGDILSLPPAALGRRCGGAFTEFLQQALGQREDLQTDFRPPVTFSDEYWFGYEVKANEELLPAAQLLLQSFCRFLRNTQLQTNEVTWQLAGIDHRVVEVRIRSASCHTDWKSWYQLTRIRFEQLQLANSVEGLALASKQLQPGQLENIDLFTPGSQREPLAALLDRLRSRLGLQAIECVGCRDEHLPEYALHTGIDNTVGTRAEPENHTQRPFWLMPEPAALRQRQGELRWNGPLSLVYGPERIEDNWWREPVSRDYYVASDDRGQYYWVFRDRLARRWYIHGIFA